MEFRDKSLTENDRLAALARYDILDTDAEPGFDDIALLACQICEAPTSLVTLIDKDRQWFKARVGFPACQTPLSQSVCAHGLRSDGLFVIPDLTQDPRTRDNALVTGEPHIRFYAGAPLTTPEGEPLGMLCVIDTKPRAGLTPAQEISLRALARQVMAQLELRRISRQERMLRGEIGHRLKNLMAIVSSVISQTLRRAQTLEAAREAVFERIGALGRAQDVLLRGAVEDAQLRALIETVVRCHDDARAFEIDGPALTIQPGIALNFALVLHELATNAVKYGALSTPQGKVRIAWRIEAGADEPEFRLTWRESGGPPVKPPTRSGFGSRLIEAGLTEAGARAQLEFAPEGVVFQFDAPLRAVAAQA